MALKKVHSVDYEAGAKRQGEVSGKNPTLTHSISIVVELAKEQEFGKASLEEVDCESEKMDSSEVVSQNECVKCGQDNEKAETEGHKGKNLSNDDEVEDEDDDEDDGECLGSELARRVVIVDEADKILWTRAQSAEPRIERRTSSSNDPGSDDTPSLGSGSISPRCTQSRPRCGLSAGFFSGATSNSVRDQTGCIPNRSGMGRSSVTTCSGGSSSSACGGGELAERGELSKLSMRRNTHHQLGPVSSPTNTHWGGSSVFFTTSLASDARATIETPKSPLAPKLSASSQQTIESRSDTLKSWPQRRQSLQISLLSGPTCVGSPCKSLNEEELRGEREFNEQVRSAKSPDLLLRHHHSSLLHLTQPARHEIQAPDQGSVLANSSRQYQRKAVTRGTHQSRANQERRVSFSCIDPVFPSSLIGRDTNAFIGPCGLSNERYPKSAGHFHRASIAYHPTLHSPLALSQDYLSNRQDFVRPNSATEASASVSPSILKSSPSRSRNSALDQQSATGSPVTETSSYLSKSGQINRHKRHSLAAHTISNLTTSILSKRESDLNNRQLDFNSRRLSLCTTSPNNQMTARNMTDSVCATAGGSRGAEESDLASGQKIGPTQCQSEGSSKTESPTTGNPSTAKDSSKVQSIMANAKLRQEEFARLLEEHEQIVNEINRVETKISGSQTNLQQ